jgi:hypothetical protein
MRRILEAITSLGQHFDEVSNGGDAYRPQNCPHCSCEGLWHHGCYHRKGVRGLSPKQSGEPVVVLRFLCNTCGRTNSRLPVCIPPRRWYDWAVQQLVLLLLLTGVSVHQCFCRCHRCVGPARSTIRRWRDWLHDRGEEFAFFLRSRRPELGAVSEPTAFWHAVISSMSLAQAMELLDRDLSVP